MSLSPTTLGHENAWVLMYNYPPKQSWPVLNHRGRNDSVDGSNRNHLVGIGGLLGSKYFGVVRNCLKSTELATIEAAIMQVLKGFQNGVITGRVIISCDIQESLRCPNHQVHRAVRYLFKQSCSTTIKSTDQQLPAFVFSGSPAAPRFWETIEHTSLLKKQRRQEISRC